MSIGLRWGLALIPVLLSAACGRTLTPSSAAPREPLVCEGNIVVQSSAELDRFAACDVVAGDLEIRQSDALDLRGLARVRQVTGALSVRDNPRLESLSGLERLKRVERLEIIDNPQLSGLEPLRRLQDVTAIHLVENPKLTSLKGLEGVKELDSLAVVRTGICHAGGLNGLRKVGNLLISDNGHLISLNALDGLREAQSVRIRNNSRLAAQSGLLRSLVRVNERLELSANPGLSERDIRSLTARPELVAATR